MDMTAGAKRLGGCGVAKKKKKGNLSGTNSGLWAWPKALEKDD